MGPNRETNKRKFTREPIHLPDILPTRRKSCLTPSFLPPLSPHPPRPSNTFTPKCKPTLRDPTSLELESSFLQLQKELWTRALRMHLAALHIQLSWKKYAVKNYLDMYT